MTGCEVVSLKSTPNVDLWIRSPIDLQLDLMDIVWIACCMTSSGYS